MKITQNKVDFSTGEIVEEKQDIKVKNFDDGEAATFYRQFLIEKGYKDQLGVYAIIRKNNTLQYPTLFGFPIKMRFSLWQAKKDNNTGKSVLWVGERNTGELTQEQVTDGVIVGNRIIKTDIVYYGVIVCPREFKVGMSIKSQSFVDYLLIPIKDVIEIVRQTNRGDIDIRKEHREKYNFDNMIDQLKEFKNEL